MIFSLLFGCKASISADASAGSDGRASADASAAGELEGKGEMIRSAGLVEGPGIAEPLASDRVLLGARHDLTLSPGKSTASCECLAVALGGSRSSGMSWSSTPPSIDDATQLSVALSSDGAPCKGEPKGSLGASYWGYRISGDDVIVLVESARGGRPLTSGAIIPRPVGAGQVYVKPASAQLPYGRPLEGKGLCKIGNPGPARSTGFTELELGADAAPAAGDTEDVP